MCMLRYVFMQCNSIDTHTYIYYWISQSLQWVSNSNASNCEQDEDDLFTLKCSTDLTLIFLKIHVQLKLYIQNGKWKKKHWEMLYKMICDLNGIFLFRFSMYECSHLWYQNSSTMSIHDWEHFSQLVKMRLHSK